MLPRVADEPSIPWKERNEDDSAEHGKTDKKVNRDGYNGIIKKRKSMMGSWLLDSLKQENQHDN
jgi:hypothetical protein